MFKKKTHEEFVNQASILHKNKYTYPDIYKGDAHKINILCSIHGKFIQQAGSHLQGCGCPKCAHDYTKKIFIKPNEIFLKKAKEIHKDKYEYPELYKGAKVKIKITCKVHGDFSQSPDKHLQKSGCPKCAGKVLKTKEQFVIQANIIHNNKFLYIGDYINAKTYIAIKCSRHGVFYQTPDSHLRGTGCPSCSTNSSKPESQWLDSLGVPNDNEHRHCRIYINNSHIIPDGFDPNTNTIYEFYGDYFHGNPLIYSHDKINDKNKKTFGELYLNTIVRAKMITDAGYNLISIWESDWKKIVK